MASRQIPRWPGDTWELKRYVWRGKGESSQLTNKQVRPIVALDSNGFYHSGLRNWSYYGNDKAKDALYHPVKTPHRADAIARANHMCGDWVAAHKEIVSEIKWSEKYDRKMQSAAEKYSRISRAEPVVRREMRR